MESTIPIANISIGNQIVLLSQRAESTVAISRKSSSK